MLRILALDLGKKRVGIAVSDALGITAQGQPTYQRSNMRADLGAIREMASELGASAFLLGLPRTLKGEESRQAEWVRDFGNRLAQRTGMPVLYWDERFTSVEAERVLRQQPGGRLERKGQVDRLAAVILLQSFLDAGCPGMDTEPSTSKDPGPAMDDFE